MYDPPMKFGATKICTLLIPTVLVALVSFSLSGCDRSLDNPSLENRSPDGAVSIMDWSAQDRLGGLTARKRPPLVAPAGARRTVMLVVTGDLKGWITRDTLYPRRFFPKSGRRGLAHLAAPLRSLRRQYPHLILLDAGDTLHGAPSGTILTESGPYPPLRFPIIKLMNTLGYDGMALGNFDLGLGWASLAHAQADSDFPWLAGNLWLTDDTPNGGGTHLAPYRIVDRNGVRVAVLGLTTPRAAMGLDPRHLDGLRIGDMTEAARFWVPFLRRVEHADLIVGLFHSGLDDEYRRDIALRANPPWGPGSGHVADEGVGLDLIVAGDAHRLSPRQATRNPAAYSVPVLEPGAYGRGMALAEFSLIERNGRWAIASLERRTLRAEPKPDPEALGVVAKTLDTVDAVLKAPTAVRFRRVPRKSEFYRCAGALSHKAAAFLAGEKATPTLSLLPMRWRFQPPRKSELGTLLRRAHLFRWMPYAETLVEADLTGRQIQLLLAGYVRHLRGWRVPNLDVFWAGGLRVELPAKGSEILSLAPATGGASLQPDDRRLVWLTAYTWHGGSGLVARALIRPDQKRRSISTPLRAAMFDLLSDPNFDPPPQCARWLEVST